MKTVFTARCCQCGEDNFRETPPAKSVNHCYCCGRMMADNEWEEEEIADVTEEKLE